MNEDIIPMPKKCKNNIKRYKGLRKPKCSGGVGCEACWEVFFKRFWKEWNEKNNVTAFS